jgi:SagB-type dehydrogenase family enzyme
MSAWDRHILEADDAAWELYHENSKLTRYGEFPQDESVVEAMVQMYESLPYGNYREILLPAARTPISVPLETAVLGRRSTRRFCRTPIGIADLASLLHFGYGVSSVNEGTQYVRSFRAAPSGGALYPLEIYFHAALVGDLPAGVFHYNPSRNSLRLIREGDLVSSVASCLIQPEVAEGASVLFFLTALFQRSTFKYGERAYRFTLLEAGHVAQNINLAAAGLGLGTLNLGGYFDHDVDELLGLNGLTHSTIYLVAVGGVLPSTEESA